MRVNDFIYEPISDEDTETLLGEFRQVFDLNAGDRVRYEYHEVDTKSFLLRYEFCAPQSVSLSWSKLYQVDDCLGRFKYYKVELGYALKTLFVAIVRYEQRFGEST